MKLRLNPLSLLMLAQTACDLTAILLGLIFVLMASSDLGGDATATVLRWSVLVVAAAYLIAPFWLWRAGGAVHRAFDRDQLRTDLTPQQLGDAQRRALTLPLRMTMVSVFVWTLSACSFPLYLWATGSTLWQLVPRLVTGVVLIGLIDATFIFYVVERMVRYRILPGLLAGQKLSELGPLPSLSIWHKLVILVVVSSALPLVTLAMLHQQPWASTELMLFVGGCFVAVGLLQGFAIAQSVLRPLGSVAAAFKQVAENDLSASVSVRSVDQMGRLSEGFNAMVEGLKRAEQIKNTFGVYVHPRLVEELAQGKVALGGELRTATVLFADIRGFTRMSESMTPGQVVTFLNQYLEEMVGAIVEAGGSVDKFIGDGIMASFGAPLAIDDSGRRAVEAGLAMIARLEGFNRKREAEGQGRVAIGVGIHTGEVVAGSIGSSKKMQYTLIGDTVNTAARIEELTKHYQVPLLVTGTTWDELHGRGLGTELESVTVRGKSVPVRVYSVTGLQPKLT